MNKLLIKLLNTDGVDRLKEFADVGPVQRANVEHFVDLVVAECIKIVSATKNEALDLAFNVDTAMTLAESDIARAFGIIRWWVYMVRKNDDSGDDPKDEKIYELKQEIIRLQGQITYLQEELASAEDEVMDLKEDLNRANNIEFWYERTHLWKDYY